LANVTNNYNLNKPLENEKVNISVLNQNMDIIDTNLKSLSDEINEVKVNIPSTEGLISQTTLNSILSSYAKTSDLPDEYDDTAIVNRIKTIEDNYLNSDDKTELAIAITIAKQEAIDTILGEAVDADFDTLQEVAEWIQADTTNSAQLITRVTNIENILDDKAEISDIPTKVSELTNDKGYLTSADIDSSQNHFHSNKAVLDKITQDYLDKIDGIAEGAETNVQSDWNAVSGDAFIKNKPEFAEVAISGSYDDLVDKPTIPSAITVDSTLNSTSTNPVQNKVLYAELNGKASTSHGTHVTYSTTTPSANGIAFVGSATTVSRSDHVHPLQTSVTGSSGSCTGNSATATKATQDESGNNIKASYVSSASLSGNSLLLKSKSGATLSTVDLSNLGGSSSGGTTIYYQSDEPVVNDTSVWIG